MSHSLYVCVYIPEFPTQALLRLRSSLRSCPVAIVAGIPPLEEVFSANCEALKIGVTLGMTRAELSAFKDLIVLRRSEKEEENTRTVLLDTAGIFTPRIEISSSQDAGFSMVLDMTGTTRMYGSVEKFMFDFTKALLALNVFGQLAASSNFNVALCIARTAIKSPIVVPMGKERQFLHDLPISVLSINRLQAEIIDSWGLKTLGELASLPEDELIARLGQHGKKLQQLSRGELYHLMIPEESIFTIKDSLSFDDAIESLDVLLFLISPLIKKIIQCAQIRAYALASVTLNMILKGGGAFIRVINPALPVLQHEILINLIHLDLIEHPPHAGIISLVVEAEPSEITKVQLGIFSPDLPEHLRLNITIARIAAMIGEERVGRAKLINSYSPDSFHMERFVSSSNNLRKYFTRSVIALRRCRPTLHVVMHRDGLRLKYFFLLGKKYTIQAAYGPWRKSGLWWSSDIWSLEEWDVHASASCDDVLLCVLTHDQLVQDWRLEAMYD